uniref:Uncharacterized protein n=1 Tax=Rhinolophus ferrumequinum TaxID=59479 RepID=A0A671E0Q8_RHIFE
MPPCLLLGDKALYFEVNATVGHIRVHNYLRDSRGILFSHPWDLTPVCIRHWDLATLWACWSQQRKMKRTCL